MYYNKVFRKKERKNALERKNIIMASITKRGKTWAYRVYYYENGERKYVSQSGFRTKAEAKDASVLKENEMLIGKKFEKDKVLLGSLMRKWFALFKEGTITQVTKARYMTIIKYVEDEFNIPLKEVTLEKYQIFLNTLAESRAKGTVKKYHETVRATMEYAIQSKIIMHDPTRGAVVKGQEHLTKHEEIKYLNYEEFNALERALLDGLQPSYATRYVMLLSMYTGMRFGECLGLTWNCINFKNKTIRIDRGFDYRFTQEFTDGKTRNAKRVIAVSDKLLEILKMIPKDGERLFPIMSNNSVNYALFRALTRAGINKKITFHALRHTHASILLSQGIQLLTVSKRLGHADPTITLQTYAHILKEKEAEENEIIRNIF